MIQIRFRMETPIDKYIREHSSAQSDALEWIQKQTNIHTNYPRMLSGPVQGQLLTMLVRISGAKNILEIGTFTGYSAVCMAYGLTQGGHIDTLEINDELEDLARRGWDRAGVSDLISLHIGDALDYLRTCDRIYDLVYIDANKREYIDYYEAVIPRLKSGGLILADDVLLGGKVYEAQPSGDKQTRGLIAFNDAVAADSRVEVVILPIRDGLSVIIKK